MNNTKINLELASDGGGDNVVAGAAAAILLDRAKGLRMKAVIQLGPAEGAETEIMGGILAAVLLKLHLLKAVEPETPIPWRVDSRYVIDAAQNIITRKEVSTSLSHRPFWLLWQSIPTSQLLQAKHVRAHSGHRENEACDKACRWIQKRGERLLTRSGEGQQGLEAKRRLGQAWLALDARELFLALRRGEDAQALLLELETRLKPMLPKAAEESAVVCR